MTGGAVKKALPPPESLYELFTAVTHPSLLHLEQNHLSVCVKHKHTHTRIKQELFVLAQGLHTRLWLKQIRAFRKKQKHVFTLYIVSICVGTVLH